MGDETGVTNPYRCWMSFADPAKPSGTQFLGAVIVEVEPATPDEIMMMRLIEGHPTPWVMATLEEAITIAAVVRTHDLGINPGGEVMTVVMPDTSEVDAEVQRWGMDRLVSPEELREAGYLNLGELEDLSEGGK